MKTFSFRLEKLLKLKERFERLKLQAHEESRLRVREQDLHLQSIEEERARNTQSERDHLTGEIDISHLRAFSRYFHHLQLQNRAGIELRSALELDRVNKREELVAAARERKGLEEYEDKLRIRHERRAEKEERSELDEIAAQRFIFNRRQDGMQR